MTKIISHFYNNKSLLVYLAVLSATFHPLSLKAGPYTIEWLSAATAVGQGTPPLVPGNIEGAIATLQNPDYGLKLSGYAYASSGIASGANSFWGYNPNIERNFRVVKSGNISNTFDLKLTASLTGQVYFSGTLGGTGSASMTATASVDGANIRVNNTPACIIDVNNTNVCDKILTVTKNGTVGTIYTLSAIYTGQAVTANLATASVTNPADDNKYAIYDIKLEAISQ